MLDRNDDAAATSVSIRNHLAHATPRHHRGSRADLRDVDSILAEVASALEPPRTPSARYAAAVVDRAGSLPAVRRIVAAGGGPQYSSDGTIRAWLRGAGLIPADALVVLLRAFPDVSFEEFARTDASTYAEQRQSDLERLRADLEALRTEHGARLHRLATRIGLAEDSLPDAEDDLPLSPG